MALTPDQQQQIIDLTTQGQVIATQMAPFLSAISVLQSMIGAGTMIDGIHSPPGVNGDISSCVVFALGQAESAAVLAAYIAGMQSYVAPLQAQLDPITAQIAQINAAA